MTFTGLVVDLLVASTFTAAAAACWTLHVACGVSFGVELRRGRYRQALANAALFGAAPLAMRAIVDWGGPLVTSVPGPNEWLGSQLWDRVAAPLTFVPAAVAVLASVLVLVKWAGHKVQRQQSGHRAPQDEEQ